MFRIVSGGVVVLLYRLGVAEEASLDWVHVFRNLANGELFWVRILRVRTFCMPKIYNPHNTDLMFG